MKSQSRIQLLTIRNIAIIVGVGILFCGLVTYSIILRSCFFLNCVPERSFNALDLDLPFELFPPKATASPMHRSSSSQGAFESGFMSFRWQGGNGRSTYEVWRFRSDREASEAFIAVSGEGVYSENMDFFYKSSVADEFAVGCGELQNFSGYRCNLGARYQEYTVNFQSIIDQEMSIEMFNAVVIFIDKQMEQYLYGERRNSSSAVGGSSWFAVARPLAASLASLAAGLLFSTYLFFLFGNAKKEEPKKRLGSHAQPFLDLNSITGSCFRSDYSASPANTRSTISCRRAKWEPCQ